MDSQLTQYINKLTDARNQSPLSLTLHDLKESPPQEALLPLIHGIPVHELHLRFCVLKQLNARLIDMIRLVDLTQINQLWSLGHRLSSLRYVLFNHIKAEMWNDVITKSNYNSQVPSISLNR